MIARHIQHRLTAGILLTLLSQGAIAQTLPSFFDDLQTSRFQARVKQLDQFIDRFNNVDKEVHELFRKHTGKPPTRTDVMAMLAHPNLDRASLERFMQYVTGRRGLRIDYHDDDWYAEAHCRVLFRGRDHQMQLVLKKETYPHGASKWVMISARAGFLTLRRNDISRIINPMSHASNFIDLYRVFEDHGNALNYASSSYEIDALSILLYHIDNGHLEFRGVTRLDFHFLQIRDWILRVEDHDDHNHPGGWLIADLIEAKPHEKDAYRKQILSIP